MSTNIQKEKGLAALIIIILLSVLLGLAAYWYLNLRPKRQTPGTDEERTVLIKKTQDTSARDMAEDEEPFLVSFEDLDEDEDTPEEINNEVLEELDQIILSLDEDDEDISDL